LRSSSPRARAIMRRSYSHQYFRLSPGEPGIVPRRRAKIGLVAKLDKAPDYESGDVGVRILARSPTHLRVGKPGNPPDSDSGDRWIEASHADHIWSNTLVRERVRLLRYAKKKQRALRSGKPACHTRESGYPAGPDAAAQLLATGGSSKQPKFPPTSWHSGCPRSRA
jgi:hypothetical protein